MSFRVVFGLHFRQKFTGLRESNFPMFHKNGVTSNSQGKASEKLPRKTTQDRAPSPKENESSIRMHLLPVATSRRKLQISAEELGELSSLSAANSNFFPALKSKMLNVNLLMLSAAQKKRRKLQRNRLTSAEFRKNRPNLNRISAIERKC